jgi:hypothetical protein
MRNAVKTRSFRIGAFLTIAVASAFAVEVGCSGSSDSSLQATTEAGGDDSQAVSDVVVPTDSPVVTPPGTVTFAYKPQWSGVTKVEVIGGFGASTDWSKTDSFLTLSDDGTGNYTGSSTLASGQYLYVYRITGDADAVPAATYQRYAVDPLQTAFAPCPATSPTYSKMDPNPCSQLTVPTSTPAAPIHIKGSLTVDSAPATGWLVLIERDEPSSHHFFVNRVTTASDGTFDLIGSAGNYRLQALLPTYLSETDLARAPASLSTLRRAISSTIPLATADVTVTAPDLAFHDYAAFAPTGAAGTLPTAFTFEAGNGVKLDVYGSTVGDAGVTEIGDPWFTSKATADGGASFDGTFNTAQAEEDAAVIGRRYMWGTEQPADASVLWTKQTMIYPITWQ